MQALYADRTWQRERATVASLTFSQSDPDRLAEARRVLAYLKAEKQLRDLIEAGPALTPLERSSLAAILLGGGA